MSKFLKDLLAVFIVLAIVFFFAGCASVTRTTPKPDVDAKAAPAKESCEAPGEWLVRNGNWVCAQPRRVIINPSAGGYNQCMLPYIPSYGGGCFLPSPYGGNTFFYYRR